MTRKHSMWGASRDRDPVTLGCLTSPGSHNETQTPTPTSKLNRQQRPQAKKSKVGEEWGVGVPEAPGLKELQLGNAGSFPSPSWKKADKIHPRSALCYLFLTCVLSAKNIQGDYRNHPWGMLFLVLLQKVKELVSQSYLTLRPWTRAPLSMGILQGRILEWVAIPFSRGSSQPRD